MGLDPEGFSGGQFCFGAEALYHAAGELPGSEFAALGYRQARRVDQSRPLGLSWGAPDGGGGNAGERPERRPLLYGRQGRVSYPSLFRLGWRTSASLPLAQSDKLTGESTASPSPCQRPPPCL